MFTLSKQLLSRQQHYDWGLRALKAVLNTGGKLIQVGHIHLQCFVYFQCYICLQCSIRLQCCIDLRSFVGYAQGGVFVCFVLGAMRTP